VNKLLPPRRLIPQWRKVSYAVNQPDMLGLVKPLEKKPSLEVDAAIIEQALASWKLTNSVGELADLLAFGVDPSAHAALLAPAKFALETPTASPVMRLVAQNILSSGAGESEVWSRGDVASEVRNIRAILRMTPNNTIGLVELAQHYLTNGNIKRAHRCLASAFQLSPKSVFVIRAFARYWVHIGRPDKAHHFVKRLSLSSEDPWLMASEIALAQVAKLPSMQLRRAQRALAVKSFSARNVTELAAAVGDSELNHGKLKEARKLFRTAFDVPNDNVLAQAIHKQGELGIEIDEQILKRASNGVFEGRALQAIIGADFETASDLTTQWGQSEPFSSRPKMLESYINGALGRYDHALSAAISGLRADPSDLLLRGNKAYALAGLGRFEEAELEIKIINAKDGDQFAPFTHATRGMIALLNGDPEAGIAIYDEAIALFSSRKDEESITTCRAFMARAAAAAEIPQRAALLTAASERFAKVPSPAGAVILRTLSQSAVVSNAGLLRRVVQWEWDVEKNTLAEKRQLTRVGAPGFLVKPRSDNNSR
jgi:tetratricopeptide (TPR) repeat protein